MYDLTQQALFEASDAVILLLDHQTGLLQTVQDADVDRVRANVTALARLATLLGLPVITTASEPNGPNGPLIPEISRFAPDAVYVPRDGEISAWDNPEFVRTVQATGRRTLVIAGVWTSVCVKFLALQAKADGFRVYAVIDASGDPSEAAARATLARFTQSAVVPTSTNAVICELQRTWNRPYAATFASLYALFSPDYGVVIESYLGAQQAAEPGSVLVAPVV